MNEEPWVSDSNASDRDAGDVSSRGEFEKLAEEKPPGFFAELLGFLGSERKWWLFPLVAFLLLVGVLLMFSGSAIAPFIYTLF